jgi:hypothetical protein
LFPALSTSGCSSSVIEITSSEVEDGEVAAVGGSVAGALADDVVAVVAGFLKKDTIDCPEEEDPSFLFVPGIVTAILTTTTGYSNGSINRITSQG